MANDPHIVPTLLAALALVSTALWAIAQHLGNRPRHPPTDPTATDLGPEPPAVVDLLTDDFAVSTEAVPATLVDLAARRWLSIEEVAGGNVLIRLRDREREEALAPYERRVLEHLRGLAVDRLIPASAMTTGPDGASTRWWRAFQREVVADAQARGLCRDRWTRATLAPIWVGVLATGGLAGLAHELGDQQEELARPGPLEALWAVTLLAALALGAWAVAVSRRALQTDTDLGLARASYWLGVREHMATIGDFGDKPAAMVALWDRHLAHAVALDLAPLVAAQLPLGAEAHRRAWSRASGRWRHIRVRYPRFRPGYGQHPLVALLGATVVGAGSVSVFAFAARVRRDEVDELADLPTRAAGYVDLGAMLLGTAALMLLGWNAAKLVLAVADTARTEEREGIVLRARVRRGWVGLTDQPGAGSDNRTKERYFVALDTGVDSGGDISAWRVRRRIFDQVRQGDRYRVRVTPRLGYVRDVQPA